MKLVLTGVLVLAWAAVVRDVVIRTVDLFTGFTCRARSVCPDRVE